MPLHEPAEATLSHDGGRLSALTSVLSVSSVVKSPFRFPRCGLLTAGCQLSSPKSFPSPTSTRLVPNSFLSPASAKTGGYTPPKNVGAPTFSIFPHIFRTFSQATPAARRERAPRTEGGRADPPPARNMRARPPLNHNCKSRQGCFRGGVNEAVAAFDQGFFHEMPGESGDARALTCFSRSAQLSLLSHTFNNPSWNKSLPQEVLASCKRLSLISAKVG